MNSKNKKLPNRRTFLQGLTLTTASIAVAPVFGQENNVNNSQLQNSQTTSTSGGLSLGNPATEPNKPIIAMLVHPKMVMQDLVGPMTVFNIMGAEIHLVWKNLDSVSTDLGISVTPTTTFEDTPQDLDVLFVPGGLGGSIDLMQDKAVLDFLSDRGETATYVTSVCTGSLLLGAAGLLKGYRATSHWYTRDHLALMGATPVNERVVQDRNRITGGGVTAGIDFGLTLAALLKSEEDAKRYQLLMEYAPAPPFNAGTPETAPTATYDRIVAERGPFIEQARALAARIGDTF
ncbi:MAG: thiamine biosynthesis protein ThiJ [SAR86 cluster bacterium]|uniref:Thiamine biosynthesis protein ThiJ n=1 Tax=SAR86 cluster bacterium TaxID=2030880 RepID=A0A2A5CGH2_9GAMM|nr:MAG: thiamine biosynthesis protein ThiJ [SAR86 cluster bacterium]